MSHKRELAPVLNAYGILVFVLFVWSPNTVLSMAERLEAAVFAYQPRFGPTPSTLPVDGRVRLLTFELKCYESGSSYLFLLCHGSVRPILPSVADNKK
ncbi:hypothetical protein P5673_012858 [Acropora cervicornis]|uniref:Uncharacterized protein n=1 Tax=Acropora cervicornis TaxID=6130 RepID=A0AAD9V764_ACRCE|nr:hypothetical protein P5673_012858 [Acropora cervicornis]